MINRSGRYHARLVVPKDLRGIVGKSELRAPLGGDYRQALRLLPGAVAQLQHQIAQAEQKAGAGQRQPGPARYPLAPDQLAHSLYVQRLAFDDEIRNSPAYPAVGQIGIDDLLVQRLRDAIAGKANDAELGALVGAQIERFRAAGNLDAEPGSNAWREIARALCHAELEALARVVERDEGDFSGTPSAPIIKDAQPPEKAPEPISLKRLWTDYINGRVQAGFMRDNGQRLRPVIESLRKFLKHDDARRVTKKDLLAWRDHLMKELSAKTVNDIYLSGVRSVFAWAFENDRLPENVAATVRQPKPKKVYGRERGYTDIEAKGVLKASRAYQPKADEFGYVRESEKGANVKRWVPIICAFTGARVSEITQLRKEDIRKVDGCWVARITPDAGTVKAGDFRDVPLHSQIIKEGFAEFVDAATSGPLFHNATEPEKYQRAAVKPPRA
ncbi:integrase [Ruegeria pomeroyi]|nr:integrase [Ruegeria pomeroyi]